MSTINAGEIYTIKEAARLVKCSEKFIRLQCRSGSLRCARLRHKTTLIKGSDLLAWLDAHSHKSDDIGSSGPGTTDIAPPGTSPAKAEKAAAVAARSALLTT